MATESKKVRIYPLVRDFYRMAESSEGIRPEEMNPSWHELTQVRKRYLNPELIAEGGMKRIYRVYDARAKRNLAMAMLRNEAPKDAFDPFIHEAWLTARLDHPNIITIHDVGVTDGRDPYFTMDLKQGITLQELIEKLHGGDRKTIAAYPLEVLLQIFIKICEAVSYAHSVNVIHLDLKPANIQIGSYGRVLVCDWGLGQVLGGDARQELDRILFNPDLLGYSTLYGQLKGTLGFMAPEQLTEAGRLDERTDVYGLGCILYSLLTWMLPLSGSEEEAIMKTKEGEIVPPALRAPDRNVPVALNAVTMKALALDPARRYASADQLCEEVQRYLTGFATEAEDAGLLKQVGLLYRRNRRFCLSVLMSLVLGVAGAVWSITSLREKERVATEARHQAERTLSLYEAGKSELEKVNSSNVKSIAALSMRILLMGNWGRSEALLKAALADVPDDAILARALGVNYFCTQRFNEAIPWLERGVHSGDALPKLAREFAASKADEVMLSLDQMKRAIKEAQNNRVILALILQDQYRRFDLRERGEVVEAYLHVINPAWTNGWFEYDIAESSLRVGGTGLTRLSIDWSVLIGLNLRRLDISGSDVKGLWVEDHLPIEHLDMRGAPIGTIWPLKQMVFLRELVVTPEQKSAHNFDILPQQINVVVRPLSE